ncbi:MULTISPECIES: hypothetical protein [unclassified Sphingopyxis]|uniref:hypothetical protein n=1 Tax=unclassified Sphingopyxis TaxID=2614943 RepID=UPI0028559991|nr:MULTISPECIES: hypothetical protein [unclassified Sphingopyxis]MDR6834312.1 hypothetical protein [Sphingopyxis sp. BE122]MDR7226581.1 hypothetical protein [Sphingopyxis sp. BE259]
MMRWSPALPPRPGCPHRRLLHLLTRTLPLGLTLGASTFRPWASANFVGARHIFPAVLAAGDAPAVAAALQAELTATEWTLPGHIVADVVVEYGGERGALQIEILTVED